MKKRKENAQANYLDYDEQGTQQVSEQIMDAYNSGVIDQFSSGVTSQKENDTL